MSLVASQRVPPRSRAGEDLPPALSWAIVVAAGLLFAWPLLVRANLFWGSDESFHIAAATGMRDGLADGHLYPRWVSNLTLGLGGPVFLFYPPLPYYAVSLASLFATSILEGMRVWIVAAALLSGISFHLAVRRWTSELGAALGAVLYVLLPYHALDLYDRFALAEYSAFVWTPLVFRFAVSLVDEFHWRDWFGLVLSSAALLVTHVLTAFMALFALGPFLGLLLVRSRRARAMAPLAAAGAAAVALVAVFLLPMLIERDWVHMDWTLDAPFADWRRNFVYRDEAALGFTPDRIGPSVDRIATSQLVVTAVAGLVLLARHGVRRSFARGPLDAAALGWASVGIGLWCWLLQTAATTPLYAYVPELETIQFPWRFSAFQLFGASFAAAFALAPPKGEGPAWAPCRALRARPALAAAVLLLAAAPGFAHTIELWEDREWVMDESLASQPRVLSRVMLEYVPQDVAVWKQLLSVRQLPARVVLSPGGQAHVEAWQSHARRIRVKTEDPARLGIRTFAYPGWKARLDGEPVETKAHPRTGALMVLVPPGDHVVTFAFESLPHRTMAALASAATALGLAGLAARLAERRRREARDARRREASGRSPRRSRAKALLLLLLLPAGPGLPGAPAPAGGVEARALHPEPPPAPAATHTSFRGARPKAPDPSPRPASATP